MPMICCRRAKAGRGASAGIIYSCLMLHELISHLRELTQSFRSRNACVVDLATNIEPLVESLALRIGRNELLLVG
jgi:hypothetical protein